MNPMYDVVILGCGEAGIFAAYEPVSYTHLFSAASSTAP